jgi:hypothetical protein
MCHQISDDRNTIKPRHHTQAWSRTPERWGRGPVLNHFSPLAFRAAIRVSLYPRRFRPPTHITKYDGETNLDHWLEDYYLTMKAEGSGDDFTIQYLPLLLLSSTKAWLE